MSGATLNGDRVIVAPTARGLFGIMAHGNAELVNSLTRPELYAVTLAVRVNPFPMGDGAAREQYRLCLAAIRDGTAWRADVELDADKLPKTAPPIGTMRLALVQQASDGVNAPTDTYLRIAAEEGGA